MPPPFQRLSVAQFADVLKAFRFTRRITAVHMHHTWRPNRAMWQGERSMQGMWRSHTVERGFSDIAQHLTIDPEGFVWTGRNWNQAPASAVGHNGNGAAGPFMFEIVGDFDRGADPFDGPQREAVLDVTTLVQRHFGLDAEALLFHNQVAAKSCPGSSIDRAAFVAALRAHVPRAAATASAPPPAGTRGSRSRAPLPLAPDALADGALVARTVALIARSAGSRAIDPKASPDEELDYEHASARAQASAATAAADAVARGLFTPPLTPEQIASLRPHVVNLRMGRFSRDGLMTTDEHDVDALLFENAAAAARKAVAEGRPFRVLLYAHGGLVKESDGLRTALKHVPFWLDNGVYPIHFVWETGLFETLRDLLERARRPFAAAAATRGIGDWFADRIGDPVIERAVRALQAGRIWGAMKASAQIASAEGGGAAYFVRQLAAFAKEFDKVHGPQGGALELHAGGHSAGSIFMAHLLQAAAATRGVPEVDSLQLLAPAIRTDAFAERVLPLVGKSLGELTVFTMRRELERADDCARLYRKSLLYLVSGACEPEPGTPLLGLEDSLRADRTLARFFGLGTMAAGRGQVVWSTSPLAEGRDASRATTHGGFDDDAPTMNAMARRLLRLDDATPLPKPYPAGAARAAADPWTDCVDWPPEVLDAIAAASGGGAPAGSLPPGLPPPAAPGAPLTPPPAPRPPAGGAPAAIDTGPPGQRLALCIGIDRYPTAPLAGCVNDARLWQQTLEGLGFTVSTLFDEQANRERLAEAIRSLFAGAQSGDEIVVQFAGHGTQAPDVDGDEADGDTPGLDEALCPHDFADGPLLIDDDIGAMIDTLPAGVRLTLFIDCCHSGTNTRLAPVAGARARRVVLTPEQKAAFVTWRAAHPAPRSRAAARAPADPVEVALAACQSKELAWESEGHGEFTLRATALLRDGGAALVPDAFHARLLEAFGASRRQTPQVQAPPARLAAPLLRPRS